MRRIWKRKPKEPVKQDVTPTLEERLRVEVGEYDNFYDNKDVEGGLEHMKQWLKTLRTSELVDIADIYLDEQDKTTIWDYSDIITIYSDILDMRCTHKDKELRELFNLVHPEWRGSDSVFSIVENLTKQVEGIQKKVDNIMMVLSKFDVTLKASDAVELAKK